MSIIEQIKAEIERLKEICTAQIKANPGQAFPFVMEMTGYDKLLSFLSTLESEKPMNPVCESKFKVGDVIQFKDGTNQYKICGVFSDHYINSIGNRMDMSYTDANFELVEHPVCENLFSFLSTLEEAAKKHFKQEWNENYWAFEGDVINTFIAGAKWQKQHDAELLEIAYNDGITIGMTKQKEQDEEEQADLFTIVALDAAQRAKEQMLKEAVEGKIIFLLNGDVAVNIGDTDKYNLGQKIRVIVLPKED